MVSMCSCGHLGDGESSQHLDTVQHGHGGCLVDGCSCEKFTYAGKVIVYTEEMEKVKSFWRHVICPECGEKRSEIECMPGTSDFATIDEGLKVVCEKCQSTFYVTSSLKRCIHCGSEEIGRNAKIIVVFELDIVKPEGEPTKQDFVDVLSEWSHKDLAELIFDAIKGDDTSINMDKVNYCFDCDKYQTKDGKLPKSKVGHLLQELDDLKEDLDKKKPVDKEK